MVTIERGLMASAPVRGVPAARREGAAWLSARQIRRTAGDAVQRPAGRTGQFRQRLEQRLGVRVAGTGEDSIRRRLLDDAAAVHNGNPLGPAADHAQVVGDQDDGHAQLSAQVVKQIEDLALDGDVQRRRRLVRDQHPGLAGQRGRDHRSLPHPAGQLMRVLGGDALRIRHPDQPEHLHGTGRCRGPASALMHRDRLADLPADSHGRIQAAGRVLEYHPHVVAPHRLHVPLRQCGQLRSGQPDRAAAIVPPGGSSRITERAVMVLPQPDSPTSPRHSPAATLRLMPSTARTVLPLRRISVRRPAISSTGSARCGFTGYPTPGPGRRSPPRCPWCHSPPPRTHRAGRHPAS